MTGDVVLMSADAPTSLKSRTAVSAPIRRGNPRCGSSLGMKTKHAHVCPQCEQAFHGRREQEYCTRRCADASKAIPWQERFWRFLPPVLPPTGCWEWQGHINENGYGYIGRGGGKGGSIRAHRASYELHFGDIADGAMVCHRCDNRRCVNPAHLFAASQSKNLRDMVHKGRAGAGMFRPGNGARYSNADVREMRVLAAKGVQYADICSRFGINRRYLSMLVRGHLRSDAGGPIRTGRVLRLADSGGRRVHAIERDAA